MTDIAVLAVYDTVELSDLAKGELGQQVYRFDTYALEDVELDRFGVLVVPSTVDQEYLVRHRGQLRDYLDGGGVLTFGGHLHGEWLPGAADFVPIAPPSLEAYRVADVAVHPVFEGVDPRDLSFRRGVSGFFARGHHPVPDGAEVLVRLSGGQPTTYVDRVSTGGTILVHTTADLFGYSSDGDSTASRIPRQLLDWAVAESERNRAAPVRKGRPDGWSPVPDGPSTATGSGIAAVYGGNSHHRRALTLDKYAQHLTGGLLYLPELADTDLTGYDCLIIPERINRPALTAAAPRILELLEAGGTVVAFGGGEPLPEFLPGVQWEHRDTNYWWWLEPGADMGLSSPTPEHSFFDHLALRDCTWHYHGALTPPEGAETLVALPNGDVLVYVDRVSTPGTLVVATLDPLSHFGAYFMPATERFLNGFMPWIAEFA